jgi:ribosomal protein L37E
MTVIVTENADTISLGGVTTGTTITVTTDKASYIFGETIQILIQSAPNQDVRLVVKSSDGGSVLGGHWDVDPLGFAQASMTFPFKFGGITYGAGTYTIQAKHSDATWNSFTEPQAYFDVYDDDSSHAAGAEGATYSAEKTVSEESKISGGCGEGTVLVNGVCQLAEPVDASRPDTFMGMMFVLIVVGILAPIIIIPLIRYRKSVNMTQSTSKKIEQYPEKQKPKQKPAKKKETSAFCENCGNTLNPKAKFCGSCGTPRA